jgi:signal transduction histidine kinase
MLATADAERRALERALHDGAQQRIAALNTTLALAGRRLESGDGDAAALVAQASEEARRCLEDLRDLAREIYPAVLAERGLGPALSDLARRSPALVEITRAPDGRFPEPVELAAYLVAASALANLAEPGEATIAAELHEGELQMSIAGISLSGDQLERLRARVESLDGRLESSAAEKPRVHASLPASPR